MQVLVDELSGNPDELWKKYEDSGRICQPASVPRLSKPIKKDSVRFVCIADTHEKLSHIVDRIPPGDVLIHAGDLTNFGDKQELIKANDIFGCLPHRYKIVIAGNHDLGFDDSEDLNLRGMSYRGRGTPQGYKLLTNCIYLQDSEVKVYGIRIYGSSWHPLPGYSFSRERGQPLLDKWNLIPEGIDVLVTHSPPLGHSDNFKGTRWGCSELLNTVEYRVKPLFHVFGHVHEQNGATTNGSTTFINASICSHRLVPINDPIIFDIPLKDGICKIATSKSWLELLAYGVVGRFKRSDPLSFSLTNRLLV
uniref:CCHC-type domain-containing protein n=1 Tax=Parascaris univalens TaxID=6257 RepID=A0A915BBR9_PARUN